MKDKCGIYFYYGTDEKLLYIGKAVDVGARWNGHTEKWKKDIIRIDVIPCPDEATLDILERYFIAKCPSKYNVAGTQHGYIDWEIPGLPDPETYTVEAFKKKYVKQSQGVPEPVPPIDERLVAMGNTIIDVDGDVNLFDKKWLHMDLDRVIFRHNGVYLISRYASIPGRLHKKREQGLSFRTNDTIHALYRYFNEFTPQIRPGKYEMEEVQAIVFPGTKEECEKFVDAIFRFTWLYDLYVIKKYRERERLDNINTYFVNVIHAAHVRALTDNSFAVEFTWSLKNNPDCYLPKANKDMYVFPFADGL